MSISIRHLAKIWRSPQVISKFPTIDRCQTIASFLTQLFQNAFVASSYVDVVNVPRRHPPGRIWRHEFDKIANSWSSAHHLQDAMVGYGQFWLWQAPRFHSMVQFLPSDKGIDNPSLLRRNVALRATHRPLHDTSRSNHNRLAPKIISSASH